MYWLQYIQTTVNAPVNSILLALMAKLLYYTYYNIKMLENNIENISSLQILLGEIISMHKLYSILK